METSVPPSETVEIIDIFFSFLHLHSLKTKIYIYHTNISNGGAKASTSYLIKYNNTGN